MKFREIFIYFEGDRALKPGFHAFFRELREAARAKRCELRPVYGKSSPDKDFRLGIESHPDAWNILLKDSEGPCDGSAALELCQKNGLSQSHARSIFWMVEMMESWFHADKDALERFYGPGFNAKAMKPNPKVEEIAKKDLRVGLSGATRNTGRGDYFASKATHGARLLELIDPKKVKAAAPNCRKLFETISARLKTES